MTAVDASSDDIVEPELLDRLVDRVVARPRADRVPTLAPFTGKVLVEVPQSTPADVDDAFVGARQAQHDWVRRPMTERVRVLHRIHDLVLDRRAALADLVQLESGKARRDAFEEVMDVASAARYAAVRGPRVLRDRRRVGALPGLTRALEVRVPKGVVGVISPWNYPLTLAISDSLPAFLAGNAVVHKPDSQAMLTALMARSIAVEAGLPESLWQIVSGPGPEIGAAVVARADYVSFTGSTATGRLVARQAGERLIGVSLELGGKNPLIVLDDADLDRAADGAVQACFSSAGQLCVSMERLYVAESVQAAFLERFLPRVRALRMGAAFDYTADMGTLSSQAQLDKVVEHVEDAQAKGATVLVGGRSRPDIGPWFFEPTVLDGVTPDMLVAQQETFGPVVSVYSVHSDDEAVAMANAGPFGLNASVWTGHTRRGIALARRLHSGVVNVNEGYAAAWGSHDLPMGGVKDSGLGRRHGAEGILRYTESQSIAVQRLHPVTTPRWTSQERHTELLTTGLRVLHALRRR